MFFRATVQAPSGISINKVSTDTDKHWRCYHGVASSSCSAELLLVSWLMHVTPRRRFLETESLAQLRSTNYLFEVNRQLLAATSTLWELPRATFSSLVTVSIQEPRNIPPTSVTCFLPWQMLLALIFIAVPLSETGSPYTSLHACRSIYSTLGPLHPKLAPVLLAQCP